MPEMCFDVNDVEDFIVKGKTMKLRIISDLHIDINPDFSLPLMGGEAQQVLIIAGDICPFIFNEGKAFDRFLVSMQDRFKEVIWIEGNHEFYGSVFDYNAYHPTEFYLDGYSFLLSTLWTDFDNENPLSMVNCKRSLNDFRVIYRNQDKETIRPADVVEFHKKDKEFLVRKLQNIDGKLIVVTHHGPSYRSVDDCYRGSKINGGFVSNLDEIVAMADLWIHGHSHTVKDYSVGDCKVICNAYGYHWENTGFDPFKVVEV